MSFAITQSQYDQVVSRLTRIENMMNDLATAQGNLVSLQQVNQLIVTLTENLQSVTEQATELEARVNLLENEPLD